MCRSTATIGVKRTGCRGAAAGGSLGCHVMAIRPLRLLGVHSGGAHHVLVTRRQPAKVAVLTDFEGTHKSLKVGTLRSQAPLEQ